MFGWIKFLNQNKMKLFKFVIGILDSRWFAAAFIIFIAGAMLWASNTSAFWLFENKVEKLSDTMEEYQEWESYRDRHDRFMRRTLFFDHCNALDEKQENEEVIEDARYTAPCNANDIELYFKIRDENFTTAL